MSIKLFKEINVRFPKTDEKIEKSYENCKKRKKFVSFVEETCQ